MKKQTGGMNGICGVVRSAFKDCCCIIYDASGSEWRSDNYPHQLFFRDELDTNALAEYSKSGSVDAGIPNGRKAVVIHPEFATRLENDMSLAVRLLADIQNWFDYSAQSCAARLPCKALLSQCVVIGAGGSIVNACEWAGGLKLWDGKAKNVEIPVRRDDYYRTVAGELPNVPDARNLVCALMFAHNPDYVKTSVGTLRLNGAF